MMKSLPLCKMTCAVQDQASGSPTEFSACFPGLSGVHAELVAALACLHGHIAPQHALLANAAAFFHHDMPPCCSLYHYCLLCIFQEKEGLIARNSLKSTYNSLHHPIWTLITRRRLLPHRRRCPWRPQKMALFPRMRSRMALNWCTARLNMSRSSEKRTSLCCTNSFTQAISSGVSGPRGCIWLWR